MARRLGRWSVVALALFAPSLAQITPGLPNDHYHSFLDPLVLALVGVGLARRGGGGATRGGVRPGWPGRLLVAAALGIALVAISVVAWPPAVSPDGGWRLVDQAAARTIATVGGQPFRLVGIPGFKNTNAMRFPLAHRGVAPLPSEACPGHRRPIVVVCDPLFDEVVGAACGGPAEDARVAERALPASASSTASTPGPAASSRSTGRRR